jgi:hypothetical protein
MNLVGRKDQPSVKPKCLPPTEMFVIKARHEFGWSQRPTKRKICGKNENHSLA